MRELTIEETQQVDGGLVRVVLGFIAGHVGGKLIDAADRGMSQPGNGFESNGFLDAVAAGNQTA